MSRVYQRGKTWYIDYSYKGRRRRKRIGQDKKLAELALKDIEVQIAKGAYLGVHEPKKVLFEDFAEEYLRFSRANKAKRSYERDITSLRMHLIPHFENRYLHEFTAHEIERYKELRLDEAEPATVNRELSCLRHLFNKAITWGFLRVNPANSVKQLKEPPGRVRYLKPREIRSLLRECHSHLKPIVQLALNTGMRRSEILNLTWRDVNFETRTITVRKTKNNESRTIPTNDTAYRELKEIYMNATCSYVFSHDGKPYTDIRRSFVSAVKEAGIIDFHFHDLRHTFASYLAMSGCNLKTIQQLMGHKTIEMTMRYSHLSNEHLQKAVDNLYRVGTNLAQKEFKKFAVDVDP